MRVAKYLHKKLIFLNLPHDSKGEAIKYLTKELCDYYKLKYNKEILQDIMKREDIKSTGLGNGLAVLHGRVDLLDKLYVAFARSDKGIDWQAVDNKPVHYIFFVAGPTKLEKEYLEVLSDISRITMRHNVKEEVHNAKKPEELIKIIRESGVRRKKRQKSDDR